MSEESPPPAHGPDDPKPPLEYRNYSDDRPERRKNISALIGGVVTGVVVVGFVGFIMAFGSIEMHSTTRPTSNQPIVFGFAGGAVLAGILAFLAIRRSNRRFALAGFLIGAAVTCMIEGICFSL